MAADMSEKEIITFQVGNYSNFVGAHFWNLQEALLKEEGGSRELNQNVLYREGLNFETGHKTYNPRVIAFDLKENIRTFNQRNEPSEEDDGGIVWEGTVEKYDRGSEDSKSHDVLNTNVLENSQSSPTIATNSLLDVTKPFTEETFSTWLDFSLARFHDKSLHCIENLHSDACRGFDNFGSGEVMFRSRRFHDEFDDRLHYFAEECDRLQGFQIFTDVHDGFAGLTSSVLLELADDYSKKGCLCFAAMPATFEDDTRQAMDRVMLNVLLSFAKYDVAGSQVVPLSLRSSYGLRHQLVELPWVDYKANLHYHTSSILASAIDTATIPYRLTGGQGTDINALVNHLSSAGRQISGLCLGLPIPVSSTFSIGELLKDGTLNQVTSLTPDFGKPENFLMQSTVIRGVPQHLLKAEDYPHTARQLSALFQYNSSLGHACPAYIAKTPCMVSPPFPNVFKPAVTQVGCVVSDYQRPHDARVQRTSALTSLVNCEDVAKPLEMLLQATDKVNVMKYPGFLEAGIEQLDIESCREDVKSSIQAYQSGYEL